MVVVIVDFKIFSKTDTALILNKTNIFYKVDVVII